MVFAAICHGQYTQLFIHLSALFRFDLDLGFEVSVVEMDGGRESTHGDDALFLE